MYNAWKNTWIFSANQTPHRYVSRSNFVYIPLHLNLSSKKFEDNIRYCISLMNPLRSILHIVNWILAATFFVSLIQDEFCFPLPVDNWWSCSAQCISSWQTISTTENSQKSLHLRTVIVKVIIHKRFRSQALGSAFHYF